MREQLTDEQRRWIEDYCNESITPEAFARFEKALESSSDFRSLTRRYLTMDSHLYRGAEMTIPLEAAWAEKAPRKSRATVRWIPWAAAAGLIFLLGLGLGGILGPDDRAEMVNAEQEDDGIAVIRDAADAIWEDNSISSMEAGSILSPGRLQLKGGLAQIEFYNGARLILEGPVDLELQSVDRVICRSGRLRALVPPTARGFTVLSPQFELVDLGTEFGVEIGESGEATVQVFDGEVELYPPDGERAPDQLRRLLGGSGLAWSRGGEIASIASEPKDYPSFEEVKSRGREISRQRFESWQRWNQQIQADPRMVVHYDFEGEDSQLIDSGTSARHGTVIGSEWTTGRWPEKQALEFKRPGDRVRVNVPGEFDALTMAAWIRMDALPARQQALLLTDEYRLNHAHWQIGVKGELRFSVRGSRPPGAPGSGFSSPVLFGPRQIGVWSFVCSTYDRESRVARHYLNGREISQHDIVSDQLIKIGPGDIGNWSVPVRNQKKAQPVRNFIGRIDGMTVWNAALDGSEILEIYRSTRP